MEDEFWELTLKEFNALVERYEANLERADYRAALICSVLANTVRDRKRKRIPYTPDDFMTNKKSKIQTDKQMFAQVEAINAILGGKVEEH